MPAETNPAVSVVIPTRNRPHLVLRAVASALAQTLTEIEVIVVIDGPDASTSQALAEVRDPRLQVVTLDAPVGGAEARNIGIRNSHGKFVALLDDDDEWSPEKLAMQLEAATKSRHCFPVVTTRLIARRPATDEVWPARPLGSHESMSEYLICRESSIRQGEGFIQTSTLFAHRSLLLRVPFRSGLPRHQDWDWLIRAASYPGVTFVWVWDTLVIYHIDGSRKSVSAAHTPGPSIDWIQENHLVTCKARAYFYATQVAARCRTLAVFSSIVRETIHYPRAFFIAMAMALTPRTLVHKFRTGSTPSHA